MPHEDGFSKFENSYIKSAYYSICDDYGVNENEVWMNGDWFYVVEYGNFSNVGKATQRSPLDNSRIITQSRGFTRKSIAKVTSLCEHASF